MARLESTATAVLVNWYQLNTNSTLWTLLILSCLHITLLNAISKHYSYNTFPKPLWPAVLPMQSSPVETSLQASAHKPPDDCVICELALVRHYKTHIHMQTCSTSTITGTETLWLGHLRVFITSQMLSTEFNDQQLFAVQRLQHLTLSAADEDNE